MNRRNARGSRIAPPEQLEDRLVLSVATTNPLEDLVTRRGGPVLGEIYSDYVDYVQSGGVGAFNPHQAAQVELIGPTVGVALRFGSGSGSFVANAAQVERMGLMVTASVPSIGLIEGFMPIAGLPSIALDSAVQSMDDVPRPLNHTTPAPTPAPAFSTTISQAAQVALKGGTALGSVYQEFLNYEQAGAQGTFSPAEAKILVVNGMSIGLDVRTPIANLATMTGQLKTLGMQVTASTTIGQVAIIEGMLPIAELPAVAANAGLVGMAPIYRPTLN